MGGKGEEKDIIHMRVRIGYVCKGKFMRRILRIPVRLFTAVTHCTYGVRSCRLTMPRTDFLTHTHT